MKVSTFYQNEKKTICLLFVKKWARKYLFSVLYGQYIYLLIPKD